MKKFVCKFLTILGILMVLSCSADTPSEPGVDGNNQPLDDKSFYIETEGMRSIATSSVNMDIDSVHHGSRRIDGNKIEDKTLLVYYDKDDQLAPVVFRNKDGKHVMFSVRESYPISDNVFAIEFDEMYVSISAPDFMAGSTRGVTDNKPVVENLRDFKIYRYWGQLIVNTQTGKAAFLSDIDFAKFNGGWDGEFWYDGNNRSSEYNLRAAYADKDNVYIPLYSRNNGRAGGIHKISLNNLTVAQPLVNPDFETIREILGSNSHALIARSEGNSWGNYLVDINGAVPPRRVSGDNHNGNRNDLNINGVVYENAYNVGTFDNEILIDDTFWNIQTSNQSRIFLFDENGNKLQPYDYSKGFRLGNVAYEAGDVINHNRNWIEVNKDNNRRSFNIDTDKSGYSSYVYDNGYWLSYPGNSDAGIYSIEYYLYKGYVSINNHHGYPTKISDNSFDLNGNIYTYRIDPTDGRVFACDTFGVEYPVLAGYWNVELKDPMYLLKTGFYARRQNVVIVEADFDNMVFKDSEGYIYEVSVHENGQYVARILQNFYDLNGNRIRSLKGMISDGVYNQDGSQKFDIEYVDEYHVKLDGKTMEVESWNSVPYYFIRDYTNRLLAIEVLIDEELKVSTGKILSMPITNHETGNWWDWNNFRLLNILPTSRNGVYNLYYYRAEQEGQENFFFVIELDINGNGSLKLKKEFNLGNTKLPDYEFRNVKNYYGQDTENRSMVWADNGHMLYWVDSEEGTLQSLNLDTGVQDSVNLGRIAGNSLARVRDKLIFSTYKAGSGVDVETFELDRFNIHGNKTMISTNFMSMVPLVELDITQL